MKKEVNSRLHSLNKFELCVFVFGSKKQREYELGFDKENAQNNTFIFINSTQITTLAAALLNTNTNTRKPVTTQTLALTQFCLYLHEYFSSKNLVFCHINHLYISPNLGLKSRTKYKKKRQQKQLQTAFPCYLAFLAIFLLSSVCKYPFPL